MSSQQETILDAEAGPPARNRKFKLFVKGTSVPIRASKQIELEVLTSREEFIALRPAWDELYRQSGCNDFFKTHEWFNCYLSYFKNAPLDLFIVVARSKGELTGVLPLFRRSEKRGPFDLVRMEFIGAPLSARRGGLVIKGMEKDFAQAFVHMLVNERPREWDFFASWDLPHSDLMMNHIVDGLRRARSPMDTFIHSQSFGIDVSKFTRYSDFQATLSTSTNKIVRCGKALFGKTGLKLSVKVYSGKEDVERAIKDYEEVFSKSWKPQEKDPNFHPQLMRHFAAKELLRLVVLYYEKLPGSSELPGVVSGHKTPIAVGLFILHEGCAAYMRTAYDPAFNKYSPGMILHTSALEHLIDVDHIDRLDFQRGSEGYKAKLGGVVTDTQYYCFAANPRSPKARLVRLAGNFWNRVRAVMERLKKKRNGAVEESESA